MEEHKDPDDPNATEWDLEAAEKNAAAEAQPEPEPVAEPEPEPPADDTGEAGDGSGEAGDGSDAAETPEGT